MVNDKSYTRQEISKLLEFADLRMKVAILVMVSTGIRVGGLACLKIKDLEYIEQYKLHSIFITLNILMIHTTLFAHLNVLPSLNCIWKQERDNMVKY